MYIEYQGFKAGDKIVSPTLRTRPGQANLLTIDVCKVIGGQFNELLIGIMLFGTAAYAIHNYIKKDGYAALYRYLPTQSVELNSCTIRQLYNTADKVYYIYGKSGMVAVTEADLRTRLPGVPEGSPSTAMRNIFTNPVIQKDVSDYLSYFVQILYMLIHQMQLYMYVCMCIRIYTYTYIYIYIYIINMHICLYTIYVYT